MAQRISFLREKKYPAHVGGLLAKTRVCSLNFNSFLLINVAMRGLLSLSLALDGAFGGWEWRSNYCRTIKRIQLTAVKHITSVMSFLTYRMILRIIKYAVLNDQFIISIQLFFHKPERRAAFVQVSTGK